MWYPIRDYTLGEARRFLRTDFSKVIKRTKYLYVTRKPPKRIGPGFFEPLLLCFCWCDFLGALYAGDGKSMREGGIGNTKRSKVFIDDILGAINPVYRKVSAELIKVYRHGPVHAYAPSGSFDIRLSDKAHHLTKSGHTVVISLEHLLDELLAGVTHFSKTLRQSSMLLEKGTLVAFNKARKELD